jgi:hypothetical protein
LLTEVDGKWIESDNLVPDQMALLHIRPSDVDKNGNPMLPFAQLKVMPDNEHEAMWQAFTGLLSVTHALSDIKALRK